LTTSRGAAIGSGGPRRSASPSRPTRAASPTLRVAARVLRVPIGPAPRWCRLGCFRPTWRRGSRRRGLLTRLAAAKLPARTGGDRYRFFFFGPETRRAMCPPALATPSGRRRNGRVATRTRQSMAATAISTRIPWNVRCCPTRATCPGTPRYPDANAGTSADLISSSYRHRTAVSA